MLHFGPLNPRITIVVRQLQLVLLRSQWAWQGIEPRISGFEFDSSTNKLTNYYKYLGNFLAECSFHGSKKWWTLIFLPYPLVPSKFIFEILGGLSVAIVTQLLKCDYLYVSWEWDGVTWNMFINPKNCLSSILDVYGSNYSLHYSKHKL